MNLHDLVTEIEYNLKEKILDILGPDWVSSDLIDPDEMFDKTVSFEGINAIDVGDIRTMSGGKMQLDLTGSIGVSLSIEVLSTQDLSVARREVYAFWLKLLTHIMSNPRLGVDHPNIIIQPGQLVEDGISDTGEHIVTSFSADISFNIERLSTQV